MKVKVISPSADRAEHFARMVRSANADLEVLTGLLATPGGLPGAINGHRSGLLIIDGVDHPQLDEIGRLSQVNPEVETIVISADLSPDFLMKAMRAGVREVLMPGLEQVAMDEAVLRVTRKRQPTAPQLGEVLMFMSCKGGSGASFIAANIAQVLSARDGRTVALLDLDLQFGDALLMLGDQRPGSDVAEVARNINRLDAELLRSAMVQISGTLSVLAAPKELSHALEVKAAHVEAIIRQARQMFDFVVLDVGRSIDALSLKALDLATHIFPVLQLTLPQVRDAKRLLGLFRSLEVPEAHVHWIVNRHQKGGDISIESLQQGLGVKRIATIPNHFSAVNASVNQGVPIDKLAKKSPVARALHEIAAGVAPPLDLGRTPSRWLSSLFGGG